MQPYELSSDSLAGAAADAFEAAGGVIRPFMMEVSSVSPDCGLIVDALFGTGLDRPLDGLYAHAVNVINAAEIPVLSCDLPSGVDGDTDRIMGTAVRADKTLMLGLAKPACALTPGSECFGELLLGDIGLPKELVAQFEPIPGICHGS
jgi:NAD(P)H-hydrate epimerase